MKKRRICRKRMVLINEDEFSGHGKLLIVNPSRLFLTEWPSRSFKRYHTRPVYVSVLLNDAGPDEPLAPSPRSFYHGPNSPASSARTTSSPLMTASQ